MENLEKNIFDDTAGEILHFQSSSKMYQVNKKGSLKEKEN